MNEPRVILLRYRLQTPEDYSYDAPPLEVELGEFAVKLSEGQLEAVPKSDFVSVRDARSALEPLLDSWCLHAMLRKGGLTGIRFLYSGASVEDLSPDEADKHVAFNETIRVSSSLNAKITAHAYPDPPGEFRNNREVEILWHFLKTAREGGASVEMLSYAFYTFLSYQAHAEENKPSEMFNTSRAVLAKLAELSSTRGTYHTARKFEASSSTLKPLSAAETKWILEAMRQIILRAGDKSLARLTLGSLSGLT